MGDLIMDIESIALKLQETTDRSLRNEGRIKKLENEHDAMHKLTTSVAVMAEKITTMASVVDDLGTRVNTIESRPSKRWDGLMEKIIFTFAAGVICFVLAKLGLQ